MRSLANVYRGVRSLCALAAIAGGLSSAGCADRTGDLGLAGAAAQSIAGVRGLASPAGLHRPCPPPADGYARCALVVAESAPSGYGPADLWSAYAVSGAVGTGGMGATVAIVDAYDDPNLESDLSVYRSTYGLSACTASSGCLSRVNQTGGSKLPPGNEAWGSEESLEADMVSALCPNCRILLVEAKSATLSDLGKAVTEAAKLGATTIATGYSGSEFHREDTNSPYDAARPVTAASGDEGFGVGFPAASPYVIAVGATTLSEGGGGSRGWTETAVSGGGCSRYAKKPSWQKDHFCSTRTDVDVAFVGDPATGVAIYDTYGFNGWMVVGGTSIGSAAIAAIYALAGNTQGIENAEGLYANASELYDIPPEGYDEATGNGTPDGTAAF